MGVEVAKQIQKSIGISFGVATGIICIGTGVGVGVSGTIKGMLAVSTLAQKLLRAGAALGGEAFLCVLCRLLRSAMVSRFLKIF